MIGAALALALAVQEAPRPSPTALAGTLYWIQCVVYGAEDRLSGDRTTEQIVDAGLSECGEHERRMRDTLRTDFGRAGGDAQLPRYRDLVRSEAIRQLEQRRHERTGPAAEPGRD